MKKERLSLTSAWKKLKPYFMQKMPMVTLITEKLTRIKIRIQYIRSEIHKVWIVLRRIFLIIEYGDRIYDLLVLIGYIPPM